MSLKTIAAAALLAAAASTALAQTAQPTQPGQSTTPPRAVTQPAAPATTAPPAAPRVTQPTAPAVAPAPAAAQPAQRPAVGQAQLINLNTATKDELDKLPQIGDVRAQAIIAKRPYKDWNDFVAKGAVPSNAEAAIKDKVRFR